MNNFNNTGTILVKMETLNNKVLLEHEDVLLSFLNNGNGILWIYGDGNNGKTTMVNAFISKYNLDVTYSSSLRDINKSRTHLIILRPDENLSLEELDVKDYQIIVENNQPPPKGLQCETIHMTMRY